MTPLAPVSSLVLRDQVATLLACQTRFPTLVPSASNFCGKLFPGLRRLAILFNVGNPGAVLDIREFEAAVRMFGLEALTFEIRRAEEIAPGLKRSRAARTPFMSLPTPS